MQDTFEIQPLKQTFKQRAGQFLIPRLPFNRRVFDIIRYELHSASIVVKMFLSARQRATIRNLKAQKELSINLASGGQGLTGWVNVEFRRFDETTLVLDLRRPLPFTDGSAKRVLAEHVVEHLDFSSDALNLAKEVHRILGPGGVFRVIVPDLEAFAKAYVAGGKVAWAALGWNLDAMPHDVHTPMHILNHTFHQGGEHLFGYDFEILSWMLKKAGFDKVERLQFKKSLDPELAIDLPNHRNDSLYVDAVKSQ